MIIDFHTHMFPDRIAESTIRFLADTCQTSPHTNGTYDGLSASTREAKIDLSVALPVVTKPSQFRSINEFGISLPRWEYFIFLAGFIRRVTTTEVNFTN